MKKLIILILLVILTGCSPQKDDIEHDGPTELVDITMRNNQIDMAIAGDGIYFTDNHKIRYYDMNSGIAVPLCNRAECNHEDDTCTAHYIDVVPTLFTNPENTKLFFFERSTPSLYDFSSNIIMTDANGANRTIIGKRQPGQDLQYSFVFDDDSFYFVLLDVGDNGYVYSLNRVNYKEGKQDVIYTDKDKIYLSTAYGSKLIFVKTLGYDPTALTASFDEVTHQIMSYDVDTGETEILDSYVATADNQQKAVFPYKNFLYTFTRNGADSACVTKTDLITGQTTHLSDEFPFFGLIDQEDSYTMFIDDTLYIYMSYSNSFKEDYRAEHYGINTVTGEIRQCTLESYNYLIEDDMSVSDFDLNNPIYKGEGGFGRFFGSLWLFGEIDDYFLCGTTCTSYSLYDKENNGIAAMVLELISKEDFYNNNREYIRIR